MSNSTSILDLPTDPVGGGNVSNNISMSATDKSSNLDQTTINQIVSGLQQATSSGATQLPSRDIPINTSNISTDEQIQPNYIPQSENIDYIKNYERTSDMIDEYNKNSNINNTLDDLYDEVQTPIMISVLYFMFQLPIFKRCSFKYFPVLFAKDGNTNIYGFVFNSVLFGMLFYLLNKITQYTSRF